MIPRKTKLIVAIVPLTLMLLGSQAWAQNSNLKARVKVRDAMDAYSTLNLEDAKNGLEKALETASELDEQTLALVYISLGVVWVGGYTDNAKGEEMFQIAICLAPKMKVDPMLSSPDIDTLFNLAKIKATEDQCPSILSDVTTGGAATNEDPPEDQLDMTDILGAEEPEITPCGDYEPLTEQRQKYELPFYLEVSPDMRGRIDKVRVHYAFDSSTDFKELAMPVRGNGFGAMLDCDRGQIRIFDPASVTYYIEGVAPGGEVVCGHGTKEYPIDVLMIPDAEPIPSIAGMMSQECAPCPPWDKSCGKTSVFLPKAGDPCTADPGCAEGFLCGDEGYCKEDDGQGLGSRGPGTFYVNLTGGSGFGYLDHEMSISQVHYRHPETDELLDPDPSWLEVDTDPKRLPRGQIWESKTQTTGTGWNGIPLRLAVGYFILPKLSVEVSGRFDVYITTVDEPLSCWEAGDGTVEGMQDVTCGRGGQADPSPVGETAEEVGKQLVARTETGEEVLVKSYQYAWMVNARVRYQLLAQRGIALSVFGGVGYGHFQYRIPSKNGDNIFFPLPGMVDIEVGLGFGYYFNDHIGLLVELPIDVVVGDGFALNLDFCVGLGFGF